MGLKLSVACIREQMTNITKKYNIVVVGAGPSGVACAITLARAGKNVLLVERGNFAGAKNMFGGALYKKSIEEFFPDFINNGAPIERFNKVHQYMLLDDEDSTTICYNNNSKDAESFTVLRPKWDRWAVAQAEKEGVCVATNTTVRELLIDTGKVIGIKTDFEEYFCDLVILADGVNSLLAKQIGLRKTIIPKNVALGVKEVLKLAPETIQERFNLKENEGCVVEIIGGPMKSMLGLAYIYTNKESIAIGIGVSLEELKQHKLKPFDLLEEIKSHPTIAQLIKGSTLLEYSAHLIPEGGYNAISDLFADGVLVIGDAAGLVNNVHWEGTNLAMTSGKFAAITAIDAIEKNDFSKQTLKKYKELLENSFVIKDMKSYQNIMDIVHDNSQSYLDFWIRKINMFFKTFITVDGVEKKKKFGDFIVQTLKQRGVVGLFKDAWGVIKIFVRFFRQ